MGFKNKNDTVGNSGPIFYQNAGVSYHPNQFVLGVPVLPLSVPSQNASPPYLSAPLGRETFEQEFVYFFVKYFRMGPWLGIYISGDNFLNCKQFFYDFALLP